MTGCHDRAPPGVVPGSDDRIVRFADTELGLIDARRALFGLGHASLPEGYPSRPYARPGSLGFAKHA